MKRRRPVVHRHLFPQNGGVVAAIFCRQRPGQQNHPVPLPREDALRKFPHSQRRNVGRVRMDVIDDGNFHSTARTVMPVNGWLIVPCPR